MLRNELDVSLHKAATLKEKPDQDNLGFGQYFTDHMLTMEWNRQEGWHAAQIRPYESFQVDPAAMVFHYGQAIFEGLKAYRSPEGSILLFRPGNNLERMNKSAARMCMPRIPVDKVLQAMKGLIYLDREWIPSCEGATLYIRPTMIATEAALGLRPAEEYMFYVIMSPVGMYYKDGFNPTRIYVEDTYVRAVPGGVGEAKTAGNYAASVKALMDAKNKNCTQVLWLDAMEHRYIEEVGASNIFFVINDVLVTPPLKGTILAGITRDSVLQLADDWGIPTEERQISIDELQAGAADGSLTEAFGAGTAAIISPVGEFIYKDQSIEINGQQTGPLTKRLFDDLQALQYGITPDPHNWRVRVA